MSDDEIIIVESNTVNINDIKINDNIIIICDNDNSDKGSKATLVQSLVYNYMYFFFNIYRNDKKNNYNNG